MQQQTLIPFLPAQQQSLQRVVRIEKNLNSLGFFSPSTSTGPRKNEKVVLFVREVPGGIKTEAKATIMGTSRGLPNTADLDKYLAFQMIVADIKKRQGTVTNPVGFTTYQLLKVLGIKPTGKRYAEVDQWLDRMSGTLIKSEGAVFFAKTRRYAKDRFHVFDKAYSVGQELPNGVIAEQNYVFLSDWQLENLNHNYVLPIDLEQYQQLKTDIAKTLVPMLYIWFYAAGTRPVQRRYGELCQYLNVKTWGQFSRAKEQLSPALNELKGLEYLGDWEICHTVDGRDFKVILKIGKVFQEEAKASVRQRDDTAAAEARFETLVKMLMERDVTEKVARRLLFGVPEDHDVEALVAWIDSLIAKDARKFANPPGMYVSFIQDGITPPSSFLSSRRRKELEQAKTQRANTESEAQIRRWEIEERYYGYVEEQISRYIAALPADARTRLMADARREAVKAMKQFPCLSKEQQTEIARRFASNMVAGEINLLTIDEFQTRDRYQQQLPLSSSEGR
jgi:hypothetical protein